MKQNKRIIQKENTIKSILSAAFELFSKKGFDANTNEISEKLNISHGLIFAYFPTKEKLIIELVQEIGTKLAEKLHNTAAKNEDLYMFLSEYINVISEYEDFYIKLICEKHKLPAECANQIICIQSAVSHYLCQIIEKLQRENKIKQIPLFFIFNTWTGLINYYLLNKELFTTKGSVLKENEKILIENYIELINKEVKL